jgi:hypothetical protein
MGTPLLVLRSPVADLSSPRMAAAWRQALVALVLTGAGLAWGQEAAPAALPHLPEGDVGIASQHPGDAGIDQDPAVVFADDFEAYSSPADLNRKWSAVFGDHSMRIAEEAGTSHAGQKALEIVMPQQGTPQSSGLQKVLKDEYDVLFLRFYSKFEKGFDYPQNVSCHNGADISAHYYTNGATPGVKADGHNKFLAAFEDEIGYRGNAPVPGPLDIYCYHPEQRDVFGDHFLPSGSVMPYSPQLGNKGSFGPSFVVRPDIVPELDRWYCFEFMVKSNTPGQHDGRIGCWVDGKLIADFPNMRFRDVATLRMERIGIGIYMANNAIRQNKKWYDDVVAATAYIGPMAKAKPRTGPPLTATPPSP